jgi:hypothetical protein
MLDAELLAAIRDVLALSPIYGEGHRKRWVRPRHPGLRTSRRGIRASRRHVLRLMRESGLLAPTRRRSAWARGA